MEAVFCEHTKDQLDLSCHIDTRYSRHPAAPTQDWETFLCHYELVGEVRILLSELWIDTLKVFSRRHCAI